MTIGSSFTKLSAIKPFKTTWKVRVKVLHSWRQFTGMAGESVEFVFADEDGTKIHATCRKSEIGRLSKDLREGEWRVIEHFGMTQASGQFRATSHRFKMSFSINTVVSSCATKGDNLFLSLANFTKIINGDHDNNFLVDVMGQVLDVQEIKTVMAAGKEKRKLEFVLRDTDDQRLNGCLWSNYADELYDACKAAKGQTVICLIRFAKINFYQGNLQITNGYDASKLIINPNCQEAIDFGQRLPSDGLSMVLKEEDVKEVQLKEKKKEDEWLTYAICPVSDLLSTNQIDKVRIVCVVTAIDTDFGWYYFGCGTCQHRVSKDLKKEASTKPRSKLPIWWCPECKTNPRKVSGKFKLHLIVEDGTGETRVMLLDTISESIVTKSAAFLLNGSFDEIQDPELLPASLKNLVGKTFEFLVGVEKEHINYGSDTYKVHRVRTGKVVVKEDSNHDLISRADTLSTIQAGDEGSVVKSNSQGTPKESGSTPSSKRLKDEVEGVPDNSSASKKLCMKVIDLENENGPKDGEHIVEAENVDEMSQKKGISKE